MTAGPLWRPFLARTSPPTEEDVAAVAERLQVSLPGDYRAVVLRHAGETPSPARIPAGRGSAPFGVLLSPAVDPDGPDASYGVLAQAAVLERWAGDRPGLSRLVPVADTTGHELVCLDFRTAGEPAVVLVNLDYPAVDERAVIRVADSFSDLLERLRS